MKMILAFFLFLFTIGVVSAGNLNLGSSNLPVLSPSASTSSASVNYSTVNVNNSQYLQGLTPQQVANLAPQTSNSTINNVAGWFHNLATHITYIIDDSDYICIGSGCKTSPSNKLTVEGGLNVSSTERYIASFEGTGIESDIRVTNLDSGAELRFGALSGTSEFPLGYGSVQIPKPFEFNVNEFIMKKSGARNMVLNDTEFSIFDLGNNIKRFVVDFFGNTNIISAGDINLETQTGYGLKAINDGTTTLETNKTATTINPDLNVLGKTVIGSSAGGQQPLKVLMDSGAYGDQKSFWVGSRGGLGGNPTFYFDNRQNGAYPDAQSFFDMSGNTIEFVNQGAGKICMGTDDSLDMCIISGGNMGIGTASPTQTLDVNGNIKTSTATICDGSEVCYSLSELNSTGTRTSQIQRNSIVYINNSGSQITNNNTLFYNGTNLGIGKGNPVNTLDVNGTAQTATGIANGKFMQFFLTGTANEYEGDIVHGSSSVDMARGIALRGLTKSTTAPAFILAGRGSSDGPADVALVAVDGRIAADMTSGGNASTSRNIFSIRNFGAEIFKMGPTGNINTTTGNITAPWFFGKINISDVQNFIYNYNQTPTTTGTTTTPITNNAVVYINNSGSQVANNNSLMLEDTGAVKTLTSNSSIIGNVGAEFNNLVVTGTNAGGCSYTYNTAPYSKTLICLGAKFTKEARVGDYIGLSTCTSSYDEIATIVNDTQLTTTNNNLGGSCGNNYVSASAMPLISKAVMIKGSDGTKILQAVSYQLSSVLTKNLFIYYSILLPNGYTFGCNGNCYFNAVSGGAYIYANNVEQGLFPTTGGFHLRGTPLVVLGNDGAGGASGSLKTEGVIRGSTNGGSTNGGGSPLKLQANSIGNNGLAYIKMSLGYPVASGTGVQPLVDVLTTTYDKIAINATMNFTVGGTRNDIVGVRNLKVEGNVSLKRAYWTGYDNSTQTLISTASAQVINISNNNDFDNYGINVVGNQNLTFGMTGDYLCILSPEFYQTTGKTGIITFWMQKNGVDVPWSNSRYSLSSNSYLAPAIPFQFDIENPATDNVRFMWWSDEATTTIYSSGALTSPTRPSIPGIILNCQKVSELTP